MIAVQRHRGFTLIEVAVVMLLIVIVLGMVGLQLGDDDSAKLRDEAKRLAVLLQMAQEEAILRGATISVAIEPDGYHFSVLTPEGKLEPLDTNETLHPRSLPDDMEFSSVSIEGAMETDETPPVLLSPTGEITPFTITLKLREISWQVVGSFDGDIKPQAPPAENERRA